MTASSDESPAEGEREEILRPRKELFPIGLDLVDLNDRRAKTRERIWSSLTLLATGAVTVLATLRLLSVSRFDASTALGVLGATATATVVFGAVLIALPYLGATITAQLGLAATWAAGPDRALLWTRYATCALFVLLFAPIQYMASVAVPLVFMAGARLLQKWKKSSAGRHAPKPPDTSWVRSTELQDRLLLHFQAEYVEVERTLASKVGDRSLTAVQKQALVDRLAEISRDGNLRLEKINESARSGKESLTVFTVAAFLPVLFQYLGTADRPWMPTEIIQTQTATTIGYVVKYDVRWVTVLTEPDRSIRYIATPDVVKREVCKNPRYSDDQRPVVLSLSSRPTPDYLPCPGLEGP